MTSDIFVSYIIPTIGRSSVDVAVQSVLNQDFPFAEFEVIVVNDSGEVLPYALWHSSPRVTILNTNKCERSFARNTGAAVAKGNYLAFLDDDDWIMPGALKNFWQLANNRLEAVWLYGGIRIVDEQNRVLGEINSKLEGNSFSQIMGGAWAPLQASIIKSSAFFAVGGFNPFICGTEDEDLCRRVAYYGEFANTPDVIACLFRGQTWSTSTNYLRASADTKYSRNLILSKPGILKRIRMSSDSSYWYGRMFKVYMSTVVWNLKQKRISTTISRVLYSMTVLGMSIPYLISSEFWAGFRAHHVPESLHFIMEKND